MLLRRLALTFSGLCAFSGKSIAQTPPQPQECQSTGTIYYANGILTRYGSARLSLNALEGGVGGSLTENERATLSFELAYNSTGGLLEDLYESILQRFATQQISIRQLLLALAGLAELPQEVRDHIASSIAERFASARHGSADIGKFVVLFRNAISSGRRVVVVAHSQGNFLTNLAYGALNETERRSLAVVSVANPDASVAGGGPYTTLFNDTVILAVAVAGQRFGLNPLPPNASNGVPSLSDLSGHTFLGSYYKNGNSTYLTINGNIVSRYRALTQPEQIFQNGAIRATLTWGAQPDVDLHAYEPNGSHVFYGATRGRSGFLDLDDVTSFGPENYFVSCSTVETGDYRIGVNYFSGSGPETANVEIRAGGSSRLFQRSLPSARGSSGDQSPSIVALVRVSRDQSGRYTYEIIDQ